MPVDMPTEKVTLEITTRRPGTAPSPMEYVVQCSQAGRRAGLWGLEQLEQLNAEIQAAQYELEATKVILRQYFEFEDPV